MSLNFVGGALGATALVAILYLHGCKDEAPKAPAPAPVSHVTPAPKPAMKPSPAKPVQYRRVTKGGRIDGTITCTSVRDFIAGKSKAELGALAKEYGVSEAQLAQYKACIR
jgi:hypothetical protein